MVLMDGLDSLIFFLAWTSLWRMLPHCHSALTKHVWNARAAGGYMANNSMVKDFPMVYKKSIHCQLS